MKKKVIWRIYHICNSQVGAGKHALIKLVNIATITFTVRELNKDFK